MRNDVHPPPLEPEFNHGKPASGVRKPVMRAIPNAKPHLHDPADRAHELDRRAENGEGVNLVFSEPEDRGDSFNTTMSTVVVGVVLLTLLVLGGMMLWK